MDKVKEWTWSAEEMLDGQGQRVDVPAHAKTVKKDHSLPQENRKKFFAESCLTSPGRSNRSKDRTELHLNVFAYYFIFSPQVTSEYR